MDRISKKVEFSLFWLIGVDCIDSCGICEILIINENDNEDDKYRDNDNDNDIENVYDNDREGGMW